MIKRIYLFLLFLFFGLTVSIAQQRTDTLKRKKTVQTSELSPEKEIYINPDALKSINLGAPRISPSSNSIGSSTEIKDLTNKILGKVNTNLEEGRPMLGFSCFGTSLVNMKRKGLSVNAMAFTPQKTQVGRGMVINSDAIKPRYLAPDRIAAMAGPSSRPAFSFSAEDMLQSIFRKTPKDYWTHYADLSKGSYNIETEMPEELVKIRMTDVAMMDSLIRSSHKKYKIVYLFCKDKDLAKQNFPEVAKFVDTRKSDFELFPISERDQKEGTACIAKYLHKAAYYNPVYVMTGKNRESMILMLDQNNQAISLLACDESISKKLEELKLLP
ncbi:hypothetical protein [Bacteroides sedimenti]|uniref:DUF4252 domain-containing protein n=1 Tax=Bacteroides sedimenti TaxID=2136147 RepID=A0ABM8IB20_9BACE